MERSSYTVDELRASVEEGTRQIESGQYYTDAQVDRMLELHHRQLARGKSFGQREFLRVVKQ